FSRALHGKVEQLWEDAVLPIAIKEEIVEITREKDDKPQTGISPEIIFNVTDPVHCAEIHPVKISDNSLMDYMIDLCISSKQRSLRLFPINDPNAWTEADLKAQTRPVFADAISAIISVWMWIWEK
ncbi:MAG: hypothetical protein U9N86_16350, partial [Bacteroidota bacterium]|nr:hypothetical protein [Bacteroidota bacterium]